MSEGETKFRRSEKNPGAIISVDASGLVAYRAKKKSKKAINKMMVEHEELKKIVDSMNDTLNKIVRMLEK